MKLKHNGSSPKEAGPSKLALSVTSVLTGDKRRAGPTLPGFLAKVVTFREY